MSKIVIYRVVSTELPFESNEIQKYILKTFAPEIGNGFSISQVAQLTKSTRQRVKRAVSRMEKAGAVMGNRAEKVQTRKEP